ncbi:MAG: hypothetical protein M3384_19095 [Acidobacteriota bacterium]|nr:hypothetical protein [Acidobacteriota bacterium]
MKLKVLFSILFIGLSAIVSFAQSDAQQQQPRQKLDISISSENPTFFVNSGAWLVKVKITNQASETLNLKDFRGIHFIFAKTLPVSNYGEALGFYGVDERAIKPGETLEFEADLKKLEWLEPPSKESTFILRSENQRPFQPALLGSYTVFATIANCEEVPLNEDSSRIEVRNCRSNMLAVKVELKADK